MLKFEHVSYQYNGNSQHVDVGEINLKVEKGECIVLCGRSGSGKTTMTKLINSLIPNFYENGHLTGRVLLRDMDTQTSEIYKISREVASVFQNPKTQFFNVNTTNEILFYLENIGCSKELMHEKLKETVQLFGISHLLDRDIFKLSGGEKQMIAMAAAYASGTEIILLDEPSSNLDEENTRRIGEILKIMKEKGRTIILSEHRFYYFKDSIDRVYYMDSGQIKHMYSKDEFFSMDEQTRVNLGLRSIDFQKLNRDRTVKSSDKTEEKSSKEIIIKNLSHEFKGMEEGNNKCLTIENAHFTFGSIVGIYGHNGVGKSTFIRILMGLENSKAEIFVNHQRLGARQRIKKSYLVMQDVNYQLFTDSVEKEVRLGKSHTCEEEDVDRVLKNLNLYHCKHLHPMCLSGGEKQRVAVASAILSGAEILCFDEPTSGMDYDHMMRISRLIKQRVHEGVIIFIISHDHEFLNCTADQIFDMEQYNHSCS